MASKLAINANQKINLDRFQKANAIAISINEIIDNNDNAIWVKL